MNYTTNYHLPQWVESDRIMMEDFNEAMEAIDTTFTKCLTAEGVPSVYGTFTLKGSNQEGDILATFSFQPRLLLVDFFDELHILPQRVSTIFFYNRTSQYRVYLKLVGNTLQISSMDESISSTYDGRCLALP